MLPVRQHLLDVVGLFWIGGLGFERGGTAEAYRKWLRMTCDRSNFAILPICQLDAAVARWRHPQFLERFTHSPPIEERFFANFGTVTRIRSEIVAE